MAEANAELFAALVKAQAAAKTVEKDAENKFHRYNYASAEAIITEAKEALSSAGLAVVLRESHIESPTETQASNGVAGILRAVWDVLHGSGGMLPVGCSWPIVPERGRPYDKAVAAARTASLGYLLRDLLNLPRVEKGTGLDDDNREDSEPPTRRGPPAKQMLDRETLMMGIKAHLDRVGVGTREADEAMAKKVRNDFVRGLNDGHQPSSVAQLAKVLARLEAMPDQAIGEQESGAP